MNGGEDFRVKPGDQGQFLGPDQPACNLDDLARYLEVDTATVSQWAQTGRLPAQRENGEWRFDRTKIEEWLAQERIK